MPELFPSIDIAMSLIEYNVTIQINLTHSLFKNVIVFAPDRDDHSDRSPYQRTITKFGKLVRRIPYLRSMSNRSILNGTFSQSFDPESNVMWADDCFTAVGRPQGEKEPEIVIDCSSDTHFGDTYVTNFDSIPPNHEVHCTFCYSTELVAREPTDDGYTAELKIHLPTENPDRSRVHRKARINTELSKCLIFIESKYIKNIAAKSSDGEDIPVEVGKRNDQTFILIPNALFGKVESVHLLLEMENLTVIERFMWNPEDTYSIPQKCPYCKELTSSSNAGLIKCNALTFSDYQGLIDRGWSRQGRYCFRPNMKTSCCPTYTIRCNMEQFKISKSQKKTISKIKTFLKPISNAQTEHRKMPKFEMDFLNPRTNPHRNASGKARRMRIAKRLEKGKPVQKGFLRDPPKSLEDRLSDGIKMETKFGDQNCSPTILFSGQSHDLEVKVVPVGSIEDLSSRADSFKIYQEYEVAIHGRGEGEGEENIWYERFIKHPFQINEGNRDRLTPGIYHCQYRLDGILIAVGVIECLLDRIYSVYMYYKPSYGFLNLGTYSGLIECFLARSNKIPWYYMGYYVHSCEKVQYKARFRPSEFSCPETFTWHSAERSFRLFEQNKYTRLNLYESIQMHKDPEEIDFEPEDLVRYIKNFPHYIGFLQDKENISNGTYETPEIAASIHRLCSLLGQRLSAKMLQFRPNFYHI